MRKKQFPQSVRKFIRREKARIRREVLDLKEQEKLIQDFYKQLLKNHYEDKRNLQSSNK